VHGARRGARRGRSDSNASRSRSKGSSARRGFSLERFVAGCSQLFRRYVILGLGLMVVLRGIGRAPVSHSGVWLPQRDRRRAGGDLDVSSPPWPWSASSSGSRR
jgi:hypothetical protein